MTNNGDGPGTRGPSKRADGDSVIIMGIVHKNGGLRENYSSVLIIFFLNHASQCGEGDRICPQAIAEVVVCGYSDR